MDDHSSLLLLIVRTVHVENYLLFSNQRNISNVYDLMVLNS